MTLDNLHLRSTRTLLSYLEQLAREVREKCTVGALVAAHIVASELCRRDLRPEEAEKARKCLEEIEEAVSREVGSL